MECFMKEDLKTINLMVEESGYSKMEINWMDGMNKRKRKAMKRKKKSSHQLKKKRVKEKREMKVNSQKNPSLNSH